MPATTAQNTRRELPRFVLRADEHWQAWLAEAARKTHRTKAQFLTAAVVRFAEAEGLPEPPERVISENE